MHRVDAWLNLPPRPIFRRNALSTRINTCGTSNCFKPAWLNGAAPQLNTPMHHEQYRLATQGLQVEAVYMEVDVEDGDLDAEAKHVLSLCDAPTSTIAAVLGGRPDSNDFLAYLQRTEHKKLKGIRRVLHTDKTPKGFCLAENFVRGIRELGKRKLLFDLCMRPTDLMDGYALAKKCPESLFMLDHCGNAHPLAFRKRPDDKLAHHSAEEWKRSMDQLAKCENVFCKISGVIARLPSGGDANDLAPIINHCLDAFGPDRVVFGSDWPVCLLGAPLLTWVRYLHEIIATRSAEDQQKLWSKNAMRIYTLS